MNQGLRALQETDMVKETERRSDVGDRKDEPSEWNSVCGDSLVAACPRFSSAGKSHEGMDPNCDSRNGCDW